MTTTETTIKIIQDRFMDVCYYSGTLLEILVCLVLASNFIKRKHQARRISGAFFVILFAGYVIDVFYELGYLFQTYLTKDFNSDNLLDIPFVKNFESIVQWYMMLFMGPSCVLLSINRFTSIFLITNHQQLWSKWFPLAFILLLLYPFMVSGYTFLEISCRLDIYSAECTQFMERDFLVSSISNLVSAGISLFIGVTTSILYRIKFKNLKNNQHNELKIEHRLLIQSISSNFMFGCWAVLSIYVPMFYVIKDDLSSFVWNQIFNFVKDIAYVSYHYGSIILLLIFSNEMRTEFLKFYRLQKVFIRRSTVTTIVSFYHNQSASLSRR